MEGGLPVPPTPFDKLEPGALVDMIAHIMDTDIQVNDRVPLTMDAITRFHSRAPPGITARQYLRRIVQYAAVENCCLLITLLYLERVAERTKRGLLVSSLTIHRLLIASVTVASKALCDNYYTNSHYAKVGGITLQELNTLELELLFLLEWQLTASMDSLEEVYARLFQRCARSGAIPAATLPTAPPNTLPPAPPAQPRPAATVASSSSTTSRSPLHPPSHASGAGSRGNTLHTLSPTRQKRQLEDADEMHPPPSPSGRASSVPLPYVS